MCDHNFVNNATCVGFACMRYRTNQATDDINMPILTSWGLPESEILDAMAKDREERQWL